MTISREKQIYNQYFAALKATYLLSAISIKMGTSNVSQTNEFYSNNSEDRKRKGTGALRCWHVDGVIAEHIILYVTGPKCVRGNCSLDH